MFISVSFCLKQSYASNKTKQGWGKVIQSSNPSINNKVIVKMGQVSCYSNLSWKSPQYFTNCEQNSAHFLLDNLILEYYDGAWYSGTRDVGGAWHASHSLITETSHARDDSCRISNHCQTKVLIFGLVHGLEMKMTSRGPGLGSEWILQRTNGAHFSFLFC